MGGAHRRIVGALIVHAEALLDDLLRLLRRVVAERHGPTPAVAQPTSSNVAAIGACARDVPAMGLRLSVVGTVGLGSRRAPGRWMGQVGRTNAPARRAALGRRCHHALTYRSPRTVLRPSAPSRRTRESTRRVNGWVC